ncbi:MAG: hypothetical protein JO250_03950 [Armatimonadetes bacterium]|nr:hypothetical protein [Armatimonadota bacterium]
MADNKTNGWGTRLFLFLVALLLFGGLTFLGVRLFQEIASPSAKSPR